MSDAFLWFWTAMIFASIGWYGFLLFLVGFKGGRELREMTKLLARRGEEQEPRM